MAELARLATEALLVQWTGVMSGTSASQDVLAFVALPFVPCYLGVRPVCAFDYTALFLHEIGVISGTSHKLGLHLSLTLLTDAMH